MATNVQNEPQSQKEYNFAQLRKQVEQERQARIAAEEKAALLEKMSISSAPIEEDDDEPYVDTKKLKKVLNQFGEQTKQQTSKEVQNAVQEALARERVNSYLEQNPDFTNVMNSDLVQKFADNYPKLAKTILNMPEGFERQQLVYENIKTLGIDRPQVKEPSIQEKINSNRRSPYYQPSNLSNSPYSQVGDFSDSGQKNAYEKLQQLKKNMRL